MTCVAVWVAIGMSFIFVFKDAVFWGLVAVCGVYVHCICMCSGGVHACALSLRTVSWGACLAYSGPRSYPFVFIILCVCIHVCALPTGLWVPGSPPTVHHCEARANACLAFDVAFKCVLVVAFALCALAGGLRYVGACVWRLTVWCARFA